MTEQEAIELLQNLNVKLTDMSGHKTNGIEKIFGWNEITAICEAINALEEVQKYRAIGTPKEIKQKLEELERWHTYRLAINVKNPFAKMSTSICYNCDHKDDYIEELEAEVEEYRKIGTPEECRTAVEKQKADKELESHDEKHILKSCLGLMQDMVDKFAEWYRWQHGEDAIDELDEEERFCIRKTYFRIVQELFLLGTNHSGGTSTRAKCEQLGVDWGEEISFDWSDR